MVDASAAGNSPAFVIPEPVREFLGSGVAVIVCSAGKDGMPHVCPAWGPEVSEDGRRLAVYAETPRCKQLLADAVETGMLAITVAMPVSARSLQFKGPCVGTRLATSGEAEAVDRHRADFTTVTALVGDPPELIRNLFMTSELRRFEIEVVQAFDQTPGPEAGRQL